MKRLAYALVMATAVAAVSLLGTDSGTHAQDKGNLTFEIYKDAKEEFRWRLKAANGRIIGTSGAGYKAKADCQHGIDLIRKGAASARVVEASAGNP
jgi:uncharacterized protein YegP (UPF0339 family)